MYMIYLMCLFQQAIMRDYAVHMDKDPPPPILRTKNKLDFSCTSCS